ncbi:MepB family protein [Chryseobacterium elymi]|uniref:MepB family protein n=1 Tax=Chryseobacterium elymi TaxID=395936 RepID=A0A3D9D923_9FLAO|nr:MepB family protein [Chryseobacterium elymi]REC74448.1 MepB family protein [Chryseobacterium elymi]
MNLKNVDELIFKPLGLKLLNVEEDIESKEYSGCSFVLKHLNIKFRTAKITPTKTGQFVTIWKRNEEGQTAPFDSNDLFDFYLISASTDNDKGIFIFPKEVLIEKGVLSHDKRIGKRGIRVYPSWDLTESKQAKATQKWQVDYFLDLSQETEAYLKKAKLLFDLKNS